MAGNDPAGLGDLFGVGAHGGGNLGELAAPRVLTLVVLDSNVGNRLSS